MAYQTHYYAMVVVVLDLSEIMKLTFKVIGG